MSYQIESMSLVENCWRMKQNNGLETKIRQHFVLNEGMGMIFS